MSARTVIAIDGPAGSGKSTVAKLVASRLGVGYVDTGATYRVVALQALRQGIPLDDATAVTSLARSVMERCALDAGSVLSFDGKPVGDEIRTPEVSEAASKIAAIADVRRVLVEHQRRLVPRGGAVVEGRDIGTVVWPDASLKVYLDASEDVRADRRIAQQNDGAAIATELHERDLRDATRPVSAMRPAADAVLVDTSKLGAEEVAAHVIELLHPDSRSAFYVFVRGTLSGLLHSAFRMKVEGRENIPAHGGVILAPNHRSLIDIPVAAAVTKRPVYFMAKEELFKGKVGGGLISKLGGFPVKRGKPDRGALNRALELLDGGHVVGIFPEGTRKPGSRFEEVEDGFAYVAMKSGAPVVPVAISGTEAVFPPGKKLPQFVKIRVQVGEPFRIGDGKVGGMLPRAKIREATTDAMGKFAVVMNEVEPR